MTRGLVLGDRVTIAQDLVRDHLIRDHVYLWPGSDCGGMRRAPALHEMPVLRSGVVAIVLGVVAVRKPGVPESVWLQVDGDEGWTWAAFLERVPRVEESK